VRGLLGQQRKQDLLHDPQLVALSRLLDRHVCGFWHEHCPSLTVIYDKITVI
jgi:hypothetical protein